jgi:hypothetical protein
MYGLIFRGVAVLAVMATLWFAWHRFTGHYEDIGRHEVQVKFDAYKVEQQKRVTDLALLWSAKVDEVAKANIRRQEATNVAFTGLEGRTGRISSGGGVRIGGDVVSLWHDASSAANATAPAGKRETSTDPVPATATAQVYDERDLAKFFVDSAKAYADAYGQWLACVNTYEALYQTQDNKGVKK